MIAKRAVLALPLLAATMAACGYQPRQLTFLNRFVTLTAEPVAVNTAFEYRGTTADATSIALSTGRGRIRELFDGPDRYDTLLLSLYEADAASLAEFRDLTDAREGVVDPPHHLSYEGEQCSVSDVKFTCVARFGALIVEGRATARALPVEADEREEVLFHAHMLLAGGYKHWINVRLGLGEGP
jgi:hypothetical protein